MLAVLALGDGDHPAGRVEQQAPGGGGALVDRRDHSLCHRGAPSAGRDLPRRVQQLLGQARHRRAATAEQLLHRALDAERADHEPASRPHGCGQPADLRPVLPHLARPTALPGRRQLIGQRADGDDGAAGVALQVELVRPGHRDRREGEQALADGRRVQRELLARPQALRRTVGSEDVVHQLDRGARRHPEQDLLPCTSGQRVGPVHRAGSAGRGGPIPRRGGAGRGPGCSGPCRGPGRRTRPRAACAGCRARWAVEGPAGRPPPRAPAGARHCRAGAASRRRARSTGWSRASPAA